MREKKHPQTNKKRKTRVLVKFMVLHQTGMLFLLLHCFYQASQILKSAFAWCCYLIHCNNLTNKILVLIFQLKYINLIYHKDFILKLYLLSILFRLNHIKYKSRILREHRYKRFKPCSSLSCFSFSLERFLSIYAACCFWKSGLMLKAKMFIPTCYLRKT